MAPAADAGRIAARLWPGDPVVLEELRGGITNVNYKASTPDGTYVIRLFGHDAGLLAIDRETERAATSMAAELGIGPELVVSAPHEGYLVTRFLPGNPVAPAQMRSAATLAEVAATLRTLHQGPAIPGTLNPFTVVDVYRDNAIARGGDPVEDYAWARPIAARIEAAVAFAMTAPCHGDLLTANFIDNAGHLYLVDWEYAGMSDPRFDLANFSAHHGFGINEDRELVRLYYGEPDQRAVAAVRLLGFMSAFREAMWSMVQHSISRLDFDFLEYAGEQFAKMRGAASGDEFRSALELLESAGSPAAGATK